MNSATTASVSSLPVGGEQSAAQPLALTHWRRGHMHFYVPCTRFTGVVASPIVLDVIDEDPQAQRVYYHPNICIPLPSET